MTRLRLKWQRLLRLTLAALLCLAVLLPLVYALRWAFFSVQPMPGAVPAPNFVFPYQSLHFTSRDGLELAGWYIPPRNGIVILLTHGYDGSRAQLVFQATALAQAGYGVLLYDMRGHGESAGDRRTLGWLEVNDLLGALDYAQAQPGVEHIGAFGFSVGGEVTLRAVALAPEIEAVVGDGASAAIFSDNPYPVDIPDLLFTPVSWWFYNFISFFSGTPQPVGVIESLPRITPRPILLIATSDNRELRQLTRFCQTAGDNCTLWNIPEAQHGGGWDARPAEYAQRLVDFFNTAFDLD
ncbi:MAG: alpha/beta fold hydrolase [Anaerolineae bacterium]